MLAACGMDGVGDGSSRVSVTVVRATPSGVVTRTSPIEFELSEAITDPPTDGERVAISPALAVRLSWSTPNRLSVLPLEPLRPNTRYVIRLLPRAVGPRYRLEDVQPLALHTPLFAVDSIDNDGRQADAETPGPVSRVWLDFTHEVRTTDLRRYLTLRADDSYRSDLAYRIVGRTEGCRSCEVELNTPVSVVHVELMPELRPLVGGVSLEKTVRRRLDSSSPAPFELSSPMPKQLQGRLAVTVLSSRTLRGPVSSGAVRVEPAVSHQVRAEGRRLIVTGNFEPGVEYRVAVVSLTARDGTPLEEPLEALVKMPALVPELAISDPSPVLSPTDVAPIVVNTVGVDKLAVRTFLVPIDNLVHVTGGLTRPELAPAESLGQWTELPSANVVGAPDALNATVLRLPGEPALGLRLLEVRAIGKPWLTDSRWIQAGWSLTAKQGLDRTRVQVLSATTRRPIRGVQVRLRTAGNHPVGPVMTDANGVAMLEHDVREPIKLVVANKDGDTGVLDLTQTVTREGRRPLHPAGLIEAFVLPSQDRFRRGDAMPVLVVARGPGLAEPTDGLKVQVRLVGDARRVWSRQETQLWRAGGARLMLQWPKNAPDGRYSVEALTDGRVIGRARVRLQGHRALNRAPAEVPPVSTSTGSARLSWTPERPRPNETLQVRWLAPAPGWVTVALESTGVWTEVRRRVGQGPALFSLTVPRTAAPGAHLVVTFEPTGAGQAITDHVWVDVGRRRPMRVSLTLPKGPHRAGTQLKARVRASAGRDGAFAIVRIVAPEAVDSALSPVRDMFQFFHRYRPPSWRTHVPTGRYLQTDLRRQPVPSPQAAARLVSGASFVTDVYKIGPGGERGIPITLPRRQGKLIVEATVWSKTRLATTRTELEVRDPIALEAAAPVALMEGDAIVLPVTLHRGPAGPATVQLTASAVGGLQVVGPSVQTFEINAGGRADGEVRIGAIRGGTVELRATTEKDSAVWRRTLAVGPVGPPSVKGSSVRARRNRATKLPWPAGPGRGRVVLGTTPVHQLAAVVTRVARADRDDLETVASRALVRQVIPDFSRPKGPPAAMKAVSGRWATSLAAVEACMGDDGPRAWPEGPPAQPMSVVQAGHAIVRAARRGLVSTNLDRWLDAVRSAARSGAPRTAAYGQWVLALGRRPDESMLQQLQTSWSGGPPDLASGVGLGAALSLADRTQQAAPFLKFRDVAALEPSDAAFVLAALADAAPKHPVIPELQGQLLTSMAGGRSEGLRSDALALVGFARLSARQPPPPPFTGTLLIGDEALRAFKKATYAVVGDFDEGFRTKADLRLQLKAGGPVYGALVVEEPSTKSGGGALKVGLRLLSDSGGAIEVARVGERVALSVEVGPLPTNLSDLRISIPVPSGLTITDIEAPDSRARIDRGPGRISFDLRASARTVLKVKLRASATYAGEFALGPVVASSTLNPDQTGASAARRLVVRAAAP